MIRRHDDVTERERIGIRRTGRTNEHVDSLCLRRRGRGRKRAGPEFCRQDEHGGQRRGGQGPGPFPSLPARGPDRLHNLFRRYIGHLIRRPAK